MHDILEPYRRRRREMYAALQSQPVVTLVGIVGEDGVRSAQLDPDLPIELTLPFDAWRVEGRPLCNFPLSIRRQVTEDELYRLHGAIAPNAIVRIRARLGDPDGPYPSFALLQEFLAVATDDGELKLRLAELNSHTFHNDFFGLFVLDRRCCEYRVQAEWNGRSVGLSLLPDDPFDFAAAVAVARALWDDAEQWEFKVRECAVNELLPLKNDHWLAPGENPLSPSAFAHRLKIWEISVCQTGSFTFHIDAGEMFTDHAVEVYGSSSTGLQGATING